MNVEGLRCTKQQRASLSVPVGGVALRDMLGPTVRSRTYGESSSLQHILDPDRQFADADTRRVIDRIGNGRRRSDIAELAEAFDAGRVHVMIFLRDQNDLDRRRI